MKLLPKVIFLCFILCFFAGCAHVQEAAKKIWGSSISHLEKERPNGQSAVFDLPYDQCFKQAEKIIAYYGGTVYLKDEKKGYLAAMGFKGLVDTTEVGVFFTVIDGHQTRVEVASMSPKLMRKVAGYVFSGLQKTKAV